MEAQAGPIYRDLRTSPGLVDAVRSTLTGAAWQRCRTYLMRNLLTRVPRSAQAMVATLVHTIFAQPDAAPVWDQHARWSSS
jgi:transposase-like protein